MTEQVSPNCSWQRQTDTLKFHSYGIKKPYENKQENIKNLYENQKRYYPVTKEGQIDEWGAVVKQQAENYQREQEEARYRKMYM